MTTPAVSTLVGTLVNEYNPDAEIFEFAATEQYARDVLSLSTKEWKQYWLEIHKLKLNTLASKVIGYIDYESVSSEMLERLFRSHGGIGPVADIVYKSLTRYDSDLQTLAESKRYAYTRAERLYKLLPIVPDSVMKKFANTSASTESPLVIYYIWDASDPMGDYIAGADKYIAMLDTKIAFYLACYSISRPNMGRFAIAMLKQSRVAARRISTCMTPEDRTDFEQYMDERLQRFSLLPRELGEIIEEYEEPEDDWLEFRRSRMDL